MDDNPEVIRSQMDQTRSDLSEKLESLENRVTEGMQSTGVAVSDTMTSVRGAVQSVSESLDFRLQVERHPWLVVGGAFALGFLAASLTSQRTRQTTSSANSHSGHWENSPPVAANRPGGSGMFNAVMGVLRDWGSQGLPIVLDYILHPQAEADPTQGMAVPIAPTTTALPLSSKPTPSSLPPRTHRFF